MSVQHKSTIYKTLEISNPFKDGQDKAYADILLDKMNELKWWRRTAFVNIFLFCIALILFFHSINQQRTVPVLVNVMPSGESQYLGEVRQSGSIQVPEASIHYQIRKFISNLRSVSTDYHVLTNNLNDCFVMVTSGYQPILRNMILNNSPFDLVGRIRRTIEVESILTITGRSYQVNWTETIIDTSAKQTISKMRAVVTIRLITPTDATIVKNPLGIYIENFEMTEL